MSKPRVRPPHSHPARTRSRGWTRQAVLIFAPLLLLAALGVRGLQVNRRAVLDEARARVSRDLDRVLSIANDPLHPAASVPQWVRIFPVPPLPAPPNEAQERLREALASAPILRDARLNELAADPPDFMRQPGVAIGDPGALMESGVPVAAIAAWERWLNDRKTSRLLAAIVIWHPSMLSEELLRRAGELAGDDAETRRTLGAAWKRWRQDESIRAVMRRHPGAAGWIGKDSAVWVENDPASGAPRGMSREAIRLFATGLAGTVEKEIAAGHAAVEMAFHGVPIIAGPEQRELLAKSERFGFTVTVVLARPGRLYAQIEKQSVWLGALLVCALAAAVAGFWTLRRSLDRERELGEAKSNFVSAVSHELRAPIASMRLMAENLETDGVVVEPARRGEYHRLIAEECRRLSVLIENVLDFARIEQGRKQYRFAEADVDELVRDVVRLLQPRAAQRGQQVNAECVMRNAESGDGASGNGAASISHCDALAIQQALINLLDNALKFSPPDSIVTVRLAAVDEARWSLAVADEGPGIPAGEREKIFERFYRIGSELCRETQGAGIGLSLVRHIAEGHGGRVDVECPDGGGSVFTLVLPFHPPQGKREDE